MTQTVLIVLLVSSLTQLLQQVGTLHRLVNFRVPLPDWEVIVTNLVPLVRKREVNLAVTAFALSTVYSTPT